MIKNRCIAVVLTVSCFAPFTRMAFAESTVEQIKNTLTFGLLSNESINKITTDLYLPSVIDGTQVIWRSSDPELIKVEKNKGIVTRPPFGEGYGGVLLSADIVNGTDFAERNFIVSVWEKDIGYTYSSELKAAAEEFRIGFTSKQNIMGLTSDLKIPGIPSGMQLTMYTDAPDIMDSNGEIIRNIESAQSFNVYFVISYGYESLKMSFPITVKAYDTNEIAEMLEQDKQWLESYMDIYTSAPVISDLKLPYSAPNGSVITWTSRSAALKPDGVIIRGDSDTNAAITAVLELDKLKETAEFNVIIRRKSPQKEEPEGTKNYSGGGGGGGGSIVSGSLSPVAESTPLPIVKTDATPNVNVSKTEDSVFKDIALTHWAYIAVETLSKQGVVSGYEGCFRPEAPITREESVKLIISALGIFVCEGGEHPFSDVKSTDWFNDYVAAAYKNSIINGISENEFGTGRNITRQDFAVIIYNAVKKNTELPLTEFKSFSDDDRISDYAAEAVYTLKGLSVINGRDNNMFEPKENISRAEAAQIIYKVLALN